MYVFLRSVDYRACYDVMYKIRLVMKKYMSWGRATNDIIEGSRRTFFQRKRFRMTALLK